MKPAQSTHQAEPFQAEAQGDHVRQRRQLVVEFGGHDRAARAINILANRRRCHLQRQCGPIEFQVAIQDLEPHFQLTDFGNG